MLVNYCQNKWSIWLNSLCNIYDFGGCRLRGYPRPRAHFGMERGRFWLDGLQCSGREDSLLQCPGNPLGRVDCEPGEAAGVVCSPHIGEFRQIS